MKIRKITLKNVQCFENLEIDLSNGEESNDLMVLLGNNGVGKSTLLRSIALGLCEESGATGLLYELATNFIRKESKDDTARIKIQFEPIRAFKKAPWIETIIKKTKYGEIDLTQEVYPKNFKVWDDLFICGYGANRRSYGTTSYTEYAVTDSIYSMFNYSTQMQNIELNVRRIGREIDIYELFQKIEYVLMLKRGSIVLRRSGIYINGPWGSYVPLGALGDGYQSTIAWIMDMYGWKLLDEKKLRSAKISGIVFIDEIEQHLHPIWQTQIVKRLRKQFEDVQFIITTHSPLVAMNSFSGNIKNFNSKMYVLNWNKNVVDISEIEEPLNELDYNQLLGSEAFGHLFGQSDDVDRTLRKFSELASIDKPSKSQLKKLNEAKHLLMNVMFPKGKTLIEREVERDYKKNLIQSNIKLKKILNKSEDD